jgi:hypothetical protein
MESAKNESGPKKNIEQPNSDIPDVSISKELSGKLKVATNPEVQQEILDSIFTSNRRAKLLTNASEDIKGRKVRYFRKMGYDQMLSLLETGKQTYESYHKDLNQKVDDSNLALFLKDYLREKSNGVSKTPVFPESLTDLLKESFRGQAQDEELDKLTQNLTYARIVPFLDKYIPQATMKLAHTGMLHQEFSPYLSMSAGGVISPAISQGRVYVELVMPDSQIIPNEIGVRGEKEVFTKLIERKNIARVYASSDKLWQDEILAKPQYAQFAETYEKKHLLNQVEEWRWHEPTGDYLPVSFKNAVAERMT